MISCNKWLVIVFLGTFFNVRAQTNIVDIINTDQIWTASGSPYIVNQNVLIKAGCTVKVMPGTKIKKTGDFKIIVEGGFEARGKKDSIIIMDSINFDFRKNSIGYNFTTNIGSVFSYCLFTGTGLFEKAISLFETSLLISNCRFYNMYYSVYGSNLNSIPIKVRIEKSIFEGGENFGYVIEYSGSKTELEMDECIIKRLYGMFLPNTCTVTGCLFYDWKGFSGFKVGEKATFKCNTFLKFKSSIFEFIGDYSKSDIVIVSNTFDSADYHLDFRTLYASSNGKFIVKNNNFLKFNIHSIRITDGSPTGVMDTLIFTKNYWGTNNFSQIRKGIWDINDTLTARGLVDFGNYHKSLIIECIEDETVEFFAGSNAGIEELNMKGFRIYPNPASNFINIQDNDYSSKTWMIYSNKGELVGKGNLNENDNHIDINNLSPGYYLIELIGGEIFIGGQKFLINR